MGFWIIMTGVTVLVPGILITTGSLFRKHPPKERNVLWGYRTSLAMKNEETWRFANLHGGKLMFRIGWLTLAVSLAGMLLTLFRSDEIVTVVSFALMMVQVAAVLGIIPVVERALRRQFDKDGNPREGTL